MPCPTFLPVGHWPPCSACSTCWYHSTVWTSYNYATINPYPCLPCSEASSPPCQASPPPPPPPAPPPPLPCLRCSFFFSFEACPPLATDQPLLFNLGLWWLVLHVAWAVHALRELLPHPKSAPAVLHTRHTRCTLSSIEDDCLGLFITT